MADRPVGGHWTGDRRCSGGDGAAMRGHHGARRACPIDHRRLDRGLVSAPLLDNDRLRNQCNAGPEGCCAVSCVGLFPGLVGVVGAGGEPGDEAGAGQRAKHGETGCACSQGMESIAGPRGDSSALVPLHRVSPNDNCWTSSFSCNLWSRDPPLTAKDCRQTADLICKCPRPARPCLFTGPAFTNRPSGSTSEELVCV
jgi:hypothetical protein